MSLLNAKRNDFLSDVNVELEIVKKWRWAIEKGRGLRSTTEEIL